MLTRSTNMPRGSGQKLEAAASPKTPTGRPSALSAGSNDKMMQMITEMNKTLKTMNENYVTKTDLNELRTSVNELTQRIDNAVLQADTALTKATEAEKRAQEAEAKVQNLEGELQQLQSKLHKSAVKCNVLQEKVASLDDYSRRENLIFEGIDESPKENCTAKIVRFLNEKLNIADAEQMEFQRIHRVGNGQKPRPIICRFLKYPEREVVWQARSNLKGSKFKIKEDFSTDTVNKRQTLFPIMMRARELNKFAAIYGNRLVIDNQTYTVNNLTSLPKELQPASVATKQVTNDITAFFTGSSPLSNFYMTNFSVEGHEYTSVEQFFQFKKAIHAEMPEIAKTILNTDSPRECKRLGDSIKCEWLPIAKTVMKQGCVAKFSQNEYAKAFLLETDNRTLVEAGPDCVWGVGMYMSDKDISIRQKWKGQNLLGQILMAVRDELSI